jgi:hypothetical protein
MVHTYESDGGLVFPVAEGDFWSAGPHLLLCGDLEKRDHFKLLERAGQPDVVYADPPWNQGNCNTFRTKAGVSGRVSGFDGFLSRLMEVLAHVARPVFCEMGNQNVDVLRAIAERSGANVRGEWGITYYRKHPCRLVHFDFGSETALESSPEGMDDDHTPLWALAHWPAGSLVFDPVTGRGLSAVSADWLGHRFAGVELNPYRVSVTLRKLADRGYTPEKVGSLR